MIIDEIKTVAFIGAGHMGCFNATKSAISGYNVLLYDHSETIVQQSVRRCEQFAAFLADSRYCAVQDVPAALARISPLHDIGEATANADLVSESVFERLDVKREVLRKLDRLCPAKTILTTNSSYLLLSDMEDVVLRKDRIAAMHSYMGSPLVDIVGGSLTSADTLTILEGYVRSTDSVPLVLKKEWPGYVLNAVLGPVLATAMLLLIEGAGSAQDIDRAWMRERRAPMGPLGILDVIGLNLVCDSWKYREDEGPIPGLQPRVLGLLAPYIDRNELGMSTGKGFYHYPEPAYQQPGFLDEVDKLRPLYQPMMLSMVAGAVLVAAAGVAEADDIDKAWIVGMSLDKGPFAILREIGVEAFLESFEQHAASERFHPEKATIVTNYVAELARSETERLT